MSIRLDNVVRKNLYCSLKEDRHKVTKKQRNTNFFLVKPGAHESLWQNNRDYNKSLITSIVKDTLLNLFCFFQIHSALRADPGFSGSNLRMHRAEIRAEAYC
jgi:hypothetical protein